MLPSKFGIFVAPVHRPGENPTLALERDIEIIEWLDGLGYDEAWIGEHHSAGWELIDSPEVFIAAAAPRTRQIHFGTGVVSLPYHNPLMVAGRMVLLDHLTRGRVTLGVGPGALISDAHMLGLDPSCLRPRMDEALGIILRLLRETEPISYSCEWFTLQDARLQLRSYTRPHLPVTVASTQSPAGMQLAGKYGLPPLSIGVAHGVRGAVNLNDQWQIAEEVAVENGHTLNRADWRVVMPMHLAESRQQALDEARVGAGRLYSEFFSGTLGRPIMKADHPDQILERMAEAGSALVGTPDDCLAGIEKLAEASGGFGTLLFLAHDWTTSEESRRSYELFARYVMPRLQGSLEGITASNQWAGAKRVELFNQQTQAIEQAHQRYEEAAGSGRPS